MGPRPHPTMAPRPHPTMARSLPSPAHGQLEPRCPKEQQSPCLQGPVPIHPALLTMEHQAATTTPGNEPLNGAAGPGDPGLPPPVS